MMSVWDDFKRLEKLNLVFKKNYSAKQATIYGNGKNQVAISVKVKMIDKNNEPLVIPDDELIKALHLVNYRSGIRLNWKDRGPDSKPWVYTDENYGYTNILSWGREIIDTEVKTQVGEQEVIFYLSATEMDSGIDVAAGIKVPNVGDFNTSEDGTNTLNGPKGKEGYRFNQPDKIHVMAKASIDYSCKKNIEAELSDLEKIDDFSGDIKNNDGSAKHTETFYDGEIWKHIITFKPIKSEHFFKEWNVIYSSINNSDLSKDMVDWDGKKVNSFDVIKGSLSPCGVISGSSKVGIGTKIYVDFWYAKEGEVNLTGNYSFYVSSSGTTENYYLCRPSLKDQNEKGTMPAIYIYKLIVNVGSRFELRNYKNDGWHNNFKSSTVTVTDNFGNSGKFKLSFNKQKYFDIPEII